jgi:plastocyanin
MSSQNSTLVGVVVAILIIGAVATLGFYQFEVAPGQNSSSSTTSSASAVNCVTTPSACAFVNITSGASTPYTGYVSGGATLYGYGPATVTVVIGKNNTVLWTNRDSAFHTATSVGGDPAPFDSGCLDGIGAACPSSTGANSYQFTFTVPGTYVYHCSYHPWMQGKVIVKSS